MDPWKHLNDEELAILTLEISFLVEVEKSFPSHYKHVQSQGHIKQKRPTVVANLIRVACLVIEIIQQ